MGNESGIQPLGLKFGVDLACLVYTGAACPISVSPAGLGFRGSGVYGFRGV